MKPDVKYIYRVHIEKLKLEEKLELLELLMQSTLDLIRKGRDFQEVDEDMESKQSAETAPHTSKPELTDFQRKILNGPVMTDEEYELYKEKKEHFAQWK